MGNRLGARRLAAVLAADIAGYTRLMEQDTDRTVAAWHEARATVIDPAIARHSGRIVKHTGDGFLAEFHTVQDAVRCALAMQEGLRGSPLTFRMGINLGDIIDDGEDIHGEGVNIAARLEALAEPGGICISGEVHALVRNRVSAGFEDLGEHTVKHVTHPVRVLALRSAGPAPDVAPAEVSESRRGRRLDEARPSIAVLPFDNMSGDPEQDYFADGIVEDVITELSRARWMTVIARNSSFTYKGRSVDVKQVGRELEVRYLLEGSVRKAANRLRITAQLIDTSTGAHLWADRFDGLMEDVFDLQDQVTARVVGTVAPTVEQAEIERARRKPTENLDAYDYYLHGLAAFCQFTKPANEIALAQFQRAVALDPTFSSALGMATRCYAQRKAFGWSSDEAGEGALARTLARQAVELGRDDAVALAAAGFTLVVYGEVVDGAAYVRRALALNPNLAWAWAVSSLAEALLGRGDTAAEHANRAMRLSPQDPHSFGMLFAAGLGGFLAGRNDEACEKAMAALRERPNFALAAGVHAASAAMSGRLDEARCAMANLREVMPDLRVSTLATWLPFQDAGAFARWAEGLHRAGLPE